MEKLTIGNTVIEYEVVPSNRAKRIRITINKDKVRVTKPNGATNKDIKDFVESKREWIFNHWQNFKQFEIKRPDKEFVAGEKFPYLGRDYMLRTVAINDKKVWVEFKANTIWLFIPDTIPSRDWSEKIKEALILWYKQEARRVFQEKLDFWAKRLGVKYTQLRIKEQKTRWGSCSGKGNINLNWKIIMTPIAVVDYLVVHELAHLKHMNHSKDFWHLVKSHLPDYEKHKKWLREEGKNLPF